MVSKETQVFLSPFWLRWEPGLAGKAKAVLSTMGLNSGEPSAHSLLASVLIPASPNLAHTFIPV